MTKETMWLAPAEQEMYFQQGREIQFHGVCRISDNAMLCTVIFSK